jgi:diguanylate cyclase (GGDEF)-like protein
VERSSARPAGLEGARAERLAEACSDLAAAAGRLAKLLGEHVEPERRQGLPGSAELNRCLAELLAEHRRYGHPFSLAVVDIDGLARINDAYGPPAGDRMLAAVAAILRRQLRDTDRVFHVEEDEFAVVAPHTGAAGLVPVARRVANLIAGGQSPDGPRIAIAAGVVACPADGLAAERLLESATEATYAAKASGAAVATRPEGSTVRR